MTGYFQSILDATETNKLSIFHVNLFWNIVNIIFRYGSKTATAVSTRSVYIKGTEVPYPLKLHFPLGYLMGFQTYL